MSEPTSPSTRNFFTQGRLFRQSIQMPQRMVCWTTLSLDRRRNLWCGKGPCVCNNLEQNGMAVPFKQVSTAHLQAIGCNKCIRTYCKCMKGFWLCPACIGMHISQLAETSWVSNVIQNSKKWIFSWDTYFNNFLSIDSLTMNPNMSYLHSPPIRNVYTSNVSLELFQKEISRWKQIVTNQLTLYLTTFWKSHKSL